MGILKLITNNYCMLLGFSPKRCTKQHSLYEIINILWISMHLYRDPSQGRKEFACQALLRNTGSGSVEKMLRTLAIVKTRQMGILNYRSGESRC